MKLLLEIAYLGTNYHGYQVQNNAVSVEGTLQRVLEDFYKCPLSLVGCSRTDAGVHAKSFFLTVEGDLYKNMPPEKLPLALAPFLPYDISVKSARLVPDDFHARYDVLYKEYEYLIWNAPIMSPFYQNRAWHCPVCLDVDLMSLAAPAFLGKHDFSSFMANGSSVKSTEREIKYLDIRKEGSLVIIRIAADGFLYNMVRIIVGTLVNVSEGKIDPLEIPNIILKKDRKAAGATLPADGLYLSRVVYKENKYFKN